MWSAVTIKRWGLHVPQRNNPSPRRADVDRQALAVGKKPQAKTEMEIA
jgi:hypothetical protein